jgi:hypothetical protein
MSEFIPFIPSDDVATDLAEQINIEYGTSWCPEYVQYICSKADPELDRFDLDILDVYAQHELITRNV